MAIRRSERLPVTPRLIYLHGFASSPSSQKARYFRERFEAVGVELAVPDLAEGDFERLTITGQLRVIERVASAEAVSLMGSSLGGYLAALYAVRHAEQVHKLVLMAPAFGFGRGWERMLGPARMESWRRAGFMPVFHYGAGREQRLGYQLIEDAQAYETFPDFQQPALIFHGIEDPAVPVSLSVEFVKNHPNAVLHTFHSGHELTDVLEPMWLETARFLGV
jgi:hypothetical protein